MRRAHGLLAALGAVLLVPLLPAAPARAAPADDVPADVRSVLAGDDLRRMLAGTADDPAFADLVGALPAEVARVYAFAQAVYDGTPTGRPVIATEQWLAVLERGGEAVGTATVWRPDGGAAELGGIDTGREVALALRGLSAEEVLVGDPPAGAFYGWDGTTLRPLNHWARELLPQPAGIDTLQRAIAARAASAPHDPMGSDVPEGGGTLLLVGGLLVLLAVVGGLAAFPRGVRRAATNDDVAPAAPPPAG